MFSPAIGLIDPNNFIGLFCKGCTLTANSGSMKNTNTMIQPSTMYYYDFYYHSGFIFMHNLSILGSPKVAFKESHEIADYLNRTEDRFFKTKKRVWKETKVSMVLCNVY